MRHTKRTNVQDVDISNISVDRKKRVIYLEVHFTTVEFDYETGVIFIDQFKRHLDTIAPVIPTITVPSQAPQ